MSFKERVAGMKENHLHYCRRSGMLRPNLPEVTTMDDIPDDLPSGAGKLSEAYPSVWDAYAALGRATAEAGPMDARTRRLVKLALAVGASSEGAVHSHARRAMAEGISDKDLMQVALLAIGTLGLPHAVKAFTWIEDVTAAKPRIG
jgi:alkylhydroperoxidase/carboxymuconolactone decarboxylase family protein YurZ